MERPPNALELQQPLIAHDLPEYGREEREWAGVSNLDSFFQKVYLYFYERGFWRMLSSRIANLLYDG